MRMKEDITKYKKPTKYISHAILLDEYNALQ